MGNEANIIPILYVALWIIASADANNSSPFPSESIVQDRRYTASLIHLLNNLTDNESQSLIHYVQQHAYANLKEMIDDKINYIDDFEDEEIFMIADNHTENELPLGTLNLSETQLQIIQAYQNASVYHMIWAIWNAHVARILPEIDQNAILEYYQEKRIESLAKQGFFARLWNLIKGLFRKENDEHNCYANDPGCIRMVVDGLSSDERRSLEEVASSGNHVEVTHFIENKLCAMPSLYEEYHKWNIDNDVPAALRDIILSLTYAQRRAIEKLRRLELIDAIKDYYRGRIERRTPKEQHEIEEFVQRMNKTFARCYNPTRVKHWLRRRAADESTK